MTAPGATRKLSSCAGCGTELAPALLSCPSCRTLVHSSALTGHAEAAEAATAAGDLPGALLHWRSALPLLPPDSAQFATISARVKELGDRIDAGAKTDKPPAPAQPWYRRAWGAIATGVIFLLSKLKLLLLGLTKLTTVASMLVYLGVYWELWGWRFAAGLVVSIYIHEMGHIAAFRRYGIKTTAPMFIPGLGALIRYREVITDPRQESRIGLAGPIWGLGAALVSFGIYRWTGAPTWAGIAKMGGFINLFNLIPVWQLDGGHGFRSLNRPERWIAAATSGALWAFTHEGLLVLLVVGAIYQAMRKDHHEKGDSNALATYVLLTAILTWLAILPVATT